MHLFIASDLHGCLKATNAMLARFEQSGAKHLLLLGDILNHGPRNAVPEHYAPAEVAERLNHYRDAIIAVRGNCDSEVDQMLLDFPVMSDTAWVLLENGQRLLLTHGHLYNKDKTGLMAKGDIMLHGHTHLPEAQWHGDIAIVNPGSVTIPRGGHLASFAVFENGTFSVRELESEREIASMTI